MLGDLPGGPIAILSLCSLANAKTKFKEFDADPGTLFMVTMRPHFDWPPFNGRPARNSARQRDAQWRAADSQKKRRAVSRGIVDRAPEVKVGAAFQNTLNSGE
jgi:hypothetical protein